MTQRFAEPPPSEILNFVLNAIRSHRQVDKGNTIKETGITNCMRHKNEDLFWIIPVTCQNGWGKAQQKSPAEDHHLTGSTLIELLPNKILGSFILNMLLPRCRLQLSREKERQKTGMTKYGNGPQTFGLR